MSEVNRLDPHALLMALAVMAALLIDFWWGEPPARFHPVVWMGNYLGRTGRWLAPVHALQPRQKPDRRRFWLGAGLWLFAAAVVAALAALLQHGAEQLPAFFGALLLGIALKPLLAWRMLRDEVLAVEVALGQSIDDGRAQLARLVSRDVRRLSGSEVRESAIESLAENLNDSLVAPLFWFALLGLPGAALYRFANTADAMWGYPSLYAGRDWSWAGKWAARADDLLSWVPARLTALLLIALGGADARARILRALPEQARLTPSPNSGWPMASMALILNVRLAKPGVYALNAGGRAPLLGDTARAAALGQMSVFACAGCAVGVIFAKAALGIAP